ncbi:MAG: glycosyltransferase family 9 protein [Chloroflexota bacterium]
MKGHAQRVLVIPFANGMGDYLNMQPLLRLIRRALPAAEISVVGTDLARPLLPDPSLKIMTPFGYDWTTSGPIREMRRILPQSAVARLAKLALFPELGKYDRVLNLFWVWEHGMDFARYWTPHLARGVAAPHAIDSLANYLEETLGLRLPPAEREPVLAPSPKGLAWADRFLAEHGLAREAPVGLVAYSNMRIKEWPLARWAALNQGLYAIGLPTVLFVPPELDGAANPFAGSPHAPLSVRTSLENVVGLLSRCRLVVGVDTGLLHFASAVGTPWVGLFGPTNPELTGPYAKRCGVALVAPFASDPRCRGCWKNFKVEEDTCRAMPGSTCLSVLDVKEVFAAVRSL